MRIAIAYNEVENSDGKSALDLAQEDTLGAVHAIEEALAGRGHEVRLVPTGSRPGELVDRLRATEAAAVVNLCEAMLGRSDRELHAVALLELSGLPVTGCSALLIGLLLDKLLVKGLLRGEGIRTPDGCAIFDRRDRGRLQDVPLPFILKPAREDASIGLDQDSVVRTREAALPVLERLLARGLAPVLAERFIEGREINALAIGGEEPERILYGEIDFSPLPEGQEPILTYRGKWDTDSDEFTLTPGIYPASLDRALEGELERIVRAGWRLLGCRGFVRFDFRVDRAGAPWVLEVNPNPDLTPGSGAQRALAAARIPFGEFLEGVIREAIERHGRSAPHRPGRAARSSAP